MRRNISRDNKIREKFAKREGKYMELKSVFLNRYMDGVVREKARLELAKEGGRLGKVRNRCVVSGRGKGIMRKLKVSRIVFKELASSGLLAGIGKSSW